MVGDLFYTDTHLCNVNGVVNEAYSVNQGRHDAFSLFR